MHRKNIPDNVKIRGRRPIEQELIRNNVDTLMTGIKQVKNKDAFIKSMFTSSELEYHKEKTNILGCFFGQGLQDLRLPCETFKNM